MRALVTALAVVVSLTCAGQYVRAGKAKLIELKLIKPRKSKSDKKKRGKRGARPKVPYYRAIIESEAKPDPKKTELVAIEDDGDVNVDIEPQVPSVIKSFKESGDSLLLVVLVQGDVVWMGDPDGDDEIKGAYGSVSGALTALVDAGPGDATAHMIMYGDQLRTWSGLLSALPSGLLPQAAFKEDRTVRLYDALGNAKTLLARDSADVKAVVIFGDGSEIDSDKKAGQLRKDIIGTGARIFTVYHSSIGEDATNKRRFSELGNRGKDFFETGGQAKRLGDQVVQIVGRIASRWHLHFPAQPFAQKGGETRSLSVEINGEPLKDGEKVVKTVEPKSLLSGGSLWWLWLLLILLIVAIIIIVVVKRRNAAAMVPPPVYATPGEAGPQRTVMLGVGGTDDGMPVVGWIVPMTGAQQYQTFKLLQGATKVGTGGESHILVYDTFMSTEHAEIVCSPGGFVLNDSGSTNGTYVNQTRVKSHDLVDNDTFTLGKTDFKFKSLQ